MPSSNKYPLYKRADSPNWYYDTTDPVTGRRTRISTRTPDEKKAIKVFLENTKTAADGYASPRSSLKQVIALYTDIETNPRRREKLVDGANYGDDHARRIAANCKYVNELISREMPSLARKRIDEVNRQDVKRIKELIVEDKGHCRQAQADFQALKTIFTQSYDDGLIDSNVALGLPNIRYEEQPREAIDADIIALLISRPDAFRSKEEWAYFTILATTGMRRSEVLALSTEQIYENTLTIDRAVKSSNWKDVGLPKWDIIRVIPLSKTTIKAIRELEPDSTGRYFKHGRYWATSVFNSIQATAIGLYPEYRAIWQHMTPHVLRHSMNTNLLCAGANPLFTAEYLAWSHQVLLDMQKRYTHIYANSLQPIADLIDKLYTEEEVTSSQKRKYGC